MDDDDNTFADDEALDYIIFQDLELRATPKKGNGKHGGCLSLIVIMLLPCRLLAILADKALGWLSVMPQ